MQALPATLEFGFCPVGAGEHSAWGNRVAVSCVCLREGSQVSGQRKHWQAVGRMEAKEGTTAIVQARNDGTGGRGHGFNPTFFTGC